MYINQAGNICQSNCLTFVTFTRLFTLKVADALQLANGISMTLIKCDQFLHTEIFEVLPFLYLRSVFK